LLYILPEYVLNSGGGIITFYRNLLPLLARQGHEIHVLVGSGVHAAEDAAPTKVDGILVETLRLDLLRKFFDRFTGYAALPGLRRYLAGAWALHEQAGGGQGFDVVEAADWGLLFVPWVVESGPPCVVQLHGSAGQIDMHDPIDGEQIQGHLIRLIEKCAVRQAAGAQAYSAANARFWSQQSGRPVQRILPAWLPLADLPPSGQRTGRGLVVGRLQRWKGPEILCQALEQLGERAPVIDWVGRDTPCGKRNRPMSQYLAERWPAIWGSRLIHRVQQSPADTLALQTEASFIVVPSIWDTFNFTCVEAMAAGTPVICSTGAGASELINDGQNGFRFDCANGESLARALDAVMHLTPSRRDAISMHAKQTICALLDPEQISKTRLASYENILARDRVSTVTPEGDWLRTAVLLDPRDGNDDEVLDQLPMNMIISHIARRLVRKARNTVGRV